MSTLPMVNVTARIHDQNGEPVAGARITMRLSADEKYCGLIVPRETTQATNANGTAVLRVWPNELGTEGSEYIVSISYGGACANPCGRSGSGSGVNRRFRVVVPNADCDLFDIMDLPPYEQRGSGQVITTEVAAYAANASKWADSAWDAVTAAEALQSRFQANADLAQAAKTAAQASAAKAQDHEQRMGRLIEDADAKISHFEAAVVTKTEQTSNQLITTATNAVRQAQNISLQAIENQTGEALQNIGSRTSQMQQAAVAAINNASSNALANIDAAGTKALRDLREEAELFGEDFEALTERAESAAKRAGCAAAAADKAADRACKCADRAEKAEQNIKGALLDVAGQIVSDEIIDVAAEKAKQGALAAARVVWAPLAEQIIRLADRHTKDISEIARGKIAFAKWRQKVNDLESRVRNLEASRFLILE